MKNHRLTALIVLLLGVTVRAEAQKEEARQDTTVDLGWIFADDKHGGLTLTSGKTYNRVEGLPILFGPTYKGTVRGADISIGALGSIRSAHGFHWDSENIGHRLTADVRFPGRRGFSIGAASFDDVAKVEPWQLSEPDGGLAAFFFKRDYFDYFGRHGGRVYASAFRGEFASVTAGYSHERWSSRRARDVFTLFRGDDAWRINPVTNDGVVHVADVSFGLDTRNSEHNPLAGWFVSAQYERGSGRFRTAGTRLEPSTPEGLRSLDYGRVLVDLRRYNRISPKRQLNARLVVGGWLHGDELPMERRFSVGGVGTLPGFDFRRVGIGADVGQCALDTGSLPGRPAECERVVLAQVEYRHELVSELFDVFNRNGIRVRGAEFRVKPAIVAFADAGRGWLVGSREGILRYPSGSLPGLDTYRTDVGIGLDLGIAGMYVAKAVSTAKEPANFFVRVRNRF